MDAVQLDRAHGKAPQQSRSRASLRRIISAAEILFAENGYEGTTVNHIVTRAHCSVGAFYARFKDKESLFLHIHDRRCEQLTQRIEFLCDLFRAENASLEVMVRQCVRALFLYGGEGRALTRVFIQRSGNDPEFHERYARTWGGVRTQLRPLMMRRVAEAGDPDPARKVDFALQLMHSLWANDVLHHGVKDITGQEVGEELVEDLIDACLAWLTPGTGKRG